MAGFHYFDGIDWHMRSSKSPNPHDLLPLQLMSAMAYIKNHPEGELNTEPLPRDIKIIIKQFYDVGEKIFEKLKINPRSPTPFGGGDVSRRAHEVIAIRDKVAKIIVTHMFGNNTEIQYIYGKTMTGVEETLWMYEYPGIGEAISHDLEKIFTRPIWGDGGIVGECYWYIGGIQEVVIEFLIRILKINVKLSID